MRNSFGIGLAFGVVWVVFSFMFGLNIGHDWGRAEGKSETLLAFVTPDSVAQMAATERLTLILDENEGEQ